MNDKQAAQQWATELLEKDNWAIIDSETTGLGNKDEICQIAVFTADNLFEWQEFVKPTIDIPADATAIHGITTEQVICSDSFENHFLTLLKAVGRRDIVIFNASYDLRMIRQSLRARDINIAFPTSDRRQCRIFTNGGSIHCAMEWYSQWVGEWNDYYGNYRWQKLPGGDHSALGDCKATLEVIKKMANQNVSAF